MYKKHLCSYNETLFLSIQIQNNLYSWNNNFMARIIKFRNNLEDDETIIFIFSTLNYSELHINLVSQPW